MTAGSGATLTDPGLRGSHSHPRRSGPPWVAGARVTRRLSTFHRSPPAGSDGGAGPGGRAHGLAQRDASAPAAFTALGARSEAATSRHREPLPPCQKQPVPVGCLAVPGKDTSDLTRVWREGRWRDSPPCPRQDGCLGLVGDEGPSWCPWVTRSSLAGVWRRLGFSATASLAKTLTVCLP